MQGKLWCCRGGEVALGDRRFVVELIKPSHYDDDGYVIQWWKSWIPSNSLACLYGIATDLAQRRALGPEVAIEIQAYDECHTVIRRDTKVTTILDECRSQKIALILAHQRIGQIEPHVMDALNNCAIRIANSDDDAEALAKRFRVEANALRLPVGQFSCFVRDKTPQAITINVREFDTSQFPPAPPKQQPPAKQAPKLELPPTPQPAAPEPEPPPSPQPRKKGR